MERRDILVHRAPTQLAPEFVYQQVEWEEDRAGVAFDISELKAFLYRQRYWIAAVVLLSMLIAAAVTMLMTPTYRATATVQIEPNVPIVEEGQEALDAPVTAANMQQYAQGQLDVLKSRNLASRVSEALNLQRDERFLSAFKIDASSPLEKREQLIGALVENLTPELPLGAQTARISFDSSDPAISSTVANAYAENLITGSIERRFQASSYARDFLTKELGRAKQRLEASERATLAYARASEIVNTGGGGTGKDGEVAAAPPSLSAASLIQMNSDLATARTARLNAEQRWRAAAGTPTMNLPEVIENGTIAGLQADRARLRAQLGRLQQTYNDDYPEVARAKAEIAAADAQINSIASQIKNSIRERYEVAARQENAISARMGGLKSDTLRDQDRRVEYDILSREAAANRDLYAGLLQRYREVSTAAGVVNNNISILDAAVPPQRPIKPRPLVNLALGLFAGLGMGLLLAFIRERLDNTIGSPDDVLGRLRQPLLGTTPIVSAPGLFADLSNPRSRISEAYHSIRSSIEFATTGAVVQSILITSSRAGEGKSTTAFAIANNFSSNGQRVLLVDADLRLPSLHKMLNLPNEKGLTNFITGRMGLPEATTTLEEFAFLSTGPIPPNPTELLAPHHVKRFLQEALCLYDLVIMDGPPVLGLADSPQIARVVEGTLLVAEAGRANRNHLKTAIRRLAAANANILGVVLTKFNAKSAGFSDDYGYDYSYGSPDEQKRLGSE